jgi:hypothetical protein
MPAYRFRVKDAAAPTRLPEPLIARRTTPGTRYVEKGNSSETRAAHQGLNRFGPRPDPNHLPQPRGRSEPGGTPGPSINPCRLSAFVSLPGCSHTSVWRVYSSSSDDFCLSSGFSALTSTIVSTARSHPKGLDKNRPNLAAEPRTNQKERTARKVQRVSQGPEQNRDTRGIREIPRNPADSFVLPLFLLHRPAFAQGMLTLSQ